MRHAFVSYKTNLMYGHVYVDNNINQPILRANCSYIYRMTYISSSSMYMYCFFYLKLILNCVINDTAVDKA